MRRFVHNIYSTQTKNYAKNLLKILPYLRLDNNSTEREKEDWRRAQERKNGKQSVEWQSIVFHAGVSLDPRI
jgi:hypothetical protein